jgi:hypothetical protein
VSEWEARLSAVGEFGEEHAALDGRRRFVLETGQFKK